MKQLSLLCALGLIPCCALAQPEHSRAELRDEVTRMRELVAACEGAAGHPNAACDAEAAPADELIAAEGGQAKFTLRWEWLHDALDRAKSANAGDRQEMMRASATRLDELEQETGGERVTTPDFARARSAADRVLERPEFGDVEPPSLWDRFLARVYYLLGRLFSGVGKLGEKAPWLGKAAEWLFFSAAAVGLLLFVRRNFQRQRLEASLRGEQAVVSAWGRAATDWAAMAEAAAANGDWREAVHCLYWAAIVRLEGKRAWRHNPARTPREYVRLLKPGSAQRESLGGLTGLLERSWYGLRPAARADYELARGWFEGLERSDGSERA